jgi:membrane-bound inhibitor of C-type lysozyme
MSTSSTIEDYYSSPNSTLLLLLKIVEYFSLAGFLGAAFINIFVPELQVAKIYEIILVATWVCLFLINRQVFQNYQQSAKISKMKKNAALYTILTSNLLVSENNPMDSSMITAARIQALEYAQELIDDYKKTRRDCRSIYYVSQTATIVLSGVTPILVLVDKLEAGVSWLKWLPVICPAIAAIVASIVTSFPFQENWVAANTAVELLEAEQEKFILGVSPLYQYDAMEDVQLSKKAQRAIENFIVQVNTIHLKQVQSASEKKQEQPPDSTPNIEANAPTKA